MKKNFNAIENDVCFPFETKFVAFSLIWFLEIFQKCLTWTKRVAEKSSGIANVPRRRALRERGSHSNAWALS